MTSEILTATSSSTKSSEKNLLLTSANESKSQDRLPPGITINNGDLAGITFSIKSKDKSSSHEFLSNSGITLDNDKVKAFELSQPISIQDVDVNVIIAGTKKKDKITGSSEGEVLAGGEGKDVLSGGEGADGFLFQNPEGFGKEEADKITDFDADEGDSVLVDKEVFDLGRKVKFKSVTGKKATKKASKSNKEFIYDGNKGLLYFNENGKAKGWGDDGGLFTKLIGAPELGASDFTIV